MDRKTLPCLLKASQHVPVYHTTVSQLFKPQQTIFTYPGLHFLFALVTPLWQSRKMSYGWKENSMLTNCLAACTHLSSTVSQLFEPQVQIIAVFTYRSPHFCFPWRRSCDHHAICCMDVKTIQCLPNPSQHVPIYLQQFPSYSYRKCKKIAVFTYRSPHFYFPWRHPCGNHAICCMDGKTIQCLPNPSQHVPIYLR